MNNFHIHLSDKSQKVWGFNSYSNEKEGKYNAIFYYGRIGTPMQKLTKTNKWFSTYYDCYDYIHKKIKEKWHKDYTVCSSRQQNKYFDLVNKYFEKEISREGLLIRVEGLLGEPN